jgi:hypothetical protein
MAVLLFSVGTFALVAGLAMVGFGIPINEFSFGNTLIGAGITAAVGGLIIIALGIAVGQLRRIAESLAGRLPGQFGQPMDVVDVADASPTAASSRAPFSPRPKADPALAGMGSLLGESANTTLGDNRNLFGAPTLRNPAEAPMAVEDEIPLSPPQTVSAPASGFDHFADRSRPVGPPPVEGRIADRFPPGLQPRPIQPARFDAMWPAEAKAPKSPTADDAKQQSPMSVRAPVTAAPKRMEPEIQKPRAVAILKSGVVDGMGYTLYVDGSIEAELPQGTLRFASINELRSHLEKNS